MPVDGAGSLEAALPPSLSGPSWRPRSTRWPSTGSSCRNGHGEPVAAHADRRRKAAEDGRRPLQSRERS